jgi:hypothetical protein
MAAPIGNNNATKNKYWSDALRKHITQNPQDLAAAAKAIFDKAKEGDVNAIREIGDRLEGKPAQTISGDPENPLSVISRIERVIVDNAND